ncbi:hypothetical protein [Fibrobacter sp. UWEL]|uniref:hypothetical protein n=1 Tax=Fibrobacter sp. UWEL TaxID=1896209 RepID=UPI000923F29F|nr:hypothetical protein [Fibrobacter sp. UWEL]SHL49071.1 hypothetical protein SAMN05720468_1341 [Fibrobacter sp. UWEL]
MEYVEDNTLMFMDVAKDEKGREAIEYGYETQDEYKDHLIRVVFLRDEQRVLDLLLLELMDKFEMYIGNDLMTTMENSKVPKALEISREFANKAEKSKEVFEKFIKQLENAVAFGSDVPEFYLQMHNPSGI